MLLFGISACSSFLDLEPQSNPTDLNFWKTEEDANSGVASIYALLRQAFNYAEGMSFYAYGDLPSDEFSTANGGVWPFPEVINMNWSMAVPSSETWHVMMRLRRYDLFYRTIDQANRVLKYVPEMPASAFPSEAIRNRLLGEAYYLRAFTYFYMSRVWGGVPIVTATVPVDEAEDLPASPADAVLAQCLADIEIAKGLLNWERGSSTNRAVRANKAALFALAAHVYAWQGNYAQCAVAADSVIQRGGLAYVGRARSSYLTIFEGQSEEGIFEISQNTANEGTRLGVGYYTLVEPYLRGQAGNPRLMISHSRIGELYASNDLRLGSAFDITTNEVSAVCIKYSNVAYTNETANAVAVFKNNIIVFRYSDVRLLQAEALAATGNSGAALAILNEVRAQAGLGHWDQSGDLFSEIIEERGRELFLEGHRYYDLIRLARYNGTLRFGPKMTSAEFNAGKYYWPFDPTLLNVNKQLRQTPFWSRINM